MTRSQMTEQLERDRLVALVERDIETADRLHAEAYQLITPGGMTLSKAQYLGSIVGGSLRYRVFEPSGDISLRISGEMAALRYRCHIEVMSDGELVILDAWHTDIWQLIREQWQAVWSQATAIKT